MLVGVPTETKNNEFRVAITPAGVAELTHRGHDVLIQSGAGNGSAISDAEFYATQTRFVDQLQTLGLAVAMLLAVGTVFGAMNTMYAAVARRTEEIGVLRALGFGRLDIMLSFMAESMLLGIAGGVLGEILGLTAAYAVGLRSQLMNVGAFIFSFRLTTSTFISTIVAALTIGAAGGILPAWRAARTSIIDSLRAL